MPGPRYFLLANRLGAYTGILQARAIEREQAERDGAPSSSGHAAPAERPTRVSDGYLLDTLSADGWVERG